MCEAAARVAGVTRVLVAPHPAYAEPVAEDLALLLLELAPAYQAVLAASTTYGKNVMPRLAVQLKNGWAAWLIAAFFLGAQHMFLPLIFDWRFMLWRFLMYLPFALFAGLMLKLRPTLLPYYMIVHALVDVSAVSVYLML